MGHILCFRSLQVATEGTSSSGSHCRPLTSPELAKVLTSSPTPLSPPFSCLLPFLPHVFYSQRENVGEIQFLFVLREPQIDTVVLKVTETLNRYECRFRNPHTYFLITDNFLWYLKLYCIRKMHVGYHRSQANIIVWVRSVH